MTSPTWMTVVTLAVTMLTFGIILGFQLAYILPRSSTGNHNHTATLPVADAIAQAAEPPETSEILDERDCETIYPATYSMDELPDDDTGEMFLPDLEAQLIADAHHAAWSKPSPQTETAQARKELIQRTLAGLRGLSDDAPTDPFPVVRQFCTTAPPGQGHQARY